MKVLPSSLNIAVWLFVKLPDIAKVETPAVPPFVPPKRTLLPKGFENLSVNLLESVLPDLLSKSKLYSLISSPELLSKIIRPLLLDTVAVTPVFGMY